ncbi:MAG: DUF3391 domain-containing protein [Gammaproteobacteria bacterium]|nr:DUF3391 domain-containing protein [Gammaproteobacteria bacterium]
MAVKNKKISSQYIDVGMYVTELDRPWIETDFLLEGFFLENPKDVNRIKSLCEFVYIDVELTTERISIDDIPELEATNKVKSIAESVTQENDSQSKRPIKRRLPKPDIAYKKTASFNSEFRTANKLYKDISSTVTQLFDHNNPHGIDVKGVKRSATAVVDSVVRNPDAFLWLTRLHEKDTHSHHRSLRTSIWAIAFARHLGLEKPKLNALSAALLMCNIGKAKLPLELLRHEDNLTDKEEKLYQRHVKLTLDALKIMGRTPQSIITIIAAHCERYDGSGYPRQLKKDDIPFLAQIAGMVSYYEEITNRRIKDNSLDSTRAVEHLYRLRDKLFMSDLVEEFIRSIGIYPVGTIVELNSKEIAIIVEQNLESKLLPKVLILRDINRDRVNSFQMIDLYQIMKNNTGARPKIINTYPLGKFGIDVDEVTNGLDRANKNIDIQKKEEDQEASSDGWGIKSLFKKIIS